MICAVHAFLGGAAGTLARTRTGAFFAGVATHLFADLVPHRDFSVPVETLMAVGALATVGVTAGFDSPTFAGAVGGVAPDIENGLVAAGVLVEPCFPTHRGKHGRPAREVSSQIALACAALGFIAWQSRRTPR